MPRKAAAVRPAELRRLWLLVAAQSCFVPGCHVVLEPPIDTGPDGFAVPAVAGFPVARICGRCRRCRCAVDLGAQFAQQALLGMLGYDVDCGADGAEGYLKPLIGQFLHGPIEIYLAEEGEFRNGSAALPCADDHEDDLEGLCRQRGCIEEPECRIRGDGHDLVPLIVVAVFSLLSELGGFKPTEGMLGFVRPLLVY